MKYYELVVRTSKAGIELISAINEELGITGAIVNDPDDVEEILRDKETYKWDFADENKLRPRINTPVITVYFENNDDGKNLMKQFRSRIIDLQNKVQSGEYGPEIGLGPLQVESRIVSDDSWKDT